MAAYIGCYVPYLPGMRAHLFPIKEKNFFLEERLVPDDIFHAVGNFTAGLCNRDICPALF